jgi:hypothetical protein
MTEINDGGPAFPTLDNAGQGVVLREWGMTKRDYFAAHAPDQPENWSAPMHLLMKSQRQPHTHGQAEVAEWHHQDFSVRMHNILMHEVSWRWAYADAMIAARGDTP